MERWNGMVEWNGGLEWNGIVELPRPPSVRVRVCVCACFVTTYTYYSVPNGGHAGLLFSIELWLASGSN